MRYARVEPLADHYGFALDPQPYLEALAGLAGDLPPGAREWAGDSAHYDFSSVRCVKDLTVGRIGLVDEGPRLVVEIDLRPNEWKHDEGLLLRYSDVRNLRVDTDEGDGTEPRLGSLQLDEALPHPAGVAHEIAFTNGSVLVVAADLTARWHQV